MMYNRFVELRFPSVGVSIGGAQLYSGSGIVKPLAVDGYISMTSTDEPNEAEINVYNLSFEIREDLLTETNNVEVWAGYAPQDADEVIDMLFTGRIRSIVNNRTGVGHVTTIRLGDGDEAYQNAKVHEQVENGEQKGQIDAAMSAFEQRGLTRGKINVPCGAIGRTTTHNGVSSQRMFDDVARSSNSTWFITNGEVNMTQKGQAIGDTGYILTPQSGMIGYPKMDDKGCEVQSLIIPGIKPYYTIEIQNRDRREQYIIESIEYNVSNGAGAHMMTMRLLTQSGQEIKDEPVTKRSGVDERGC